MAHVGKRSTLQMMLFVRAHIRSAAAGLHSAELHLNEGAWQLAWFELLMNASMVASVADLIAPWDVVAQETLRDVRELADRLAARIAFGGIAYPEEPQHNEERGTK